MARPFGVALLVAGWDHRGPVLYHTDPSGTFTRFDAKAIGAGSEGAQTALQEQYHKNLTLVEAETMAITVLKQVMEEKLDATNVEVASVRMPPPKPDVPLTAACHYVPGAKNAPQFALYNQAQLQEALARVAAAAASS
jgi:hypothetical protein